MEDIAYLDNAASAPMYPLVLEAMLEYGRTHTANPTGSHLTAQKSRKVLDDAREHLADICGVEPGGVVFCSGGTEANNLAIFGAGASSFGAGASSLCSAIEHPSVLRPTQKMARNGKASKTSASSELSVIIGVQPSGVLDLDHLTDLLDPQTRLVSVMAVNNETGLIQPLQEIARIVREKSPQALLHTDAVQAMLWLDIAELIKDFDLISLSAHKFGGPTGIGALLIRSHLEQNLAPQLLGGKQERDIRSGTQNVMGALGMSKAASITAKQRATLVKSVENLRGHLEAGLLEQIPDIHITGRDAIHSSKSLPPISTPPISMPPRVAGICHMCIPDISGEALLFLMTQKGLEASGASSCASGAAEPSHVLSAMGYPPNLMKGSLRLSLGPTTTQKDIDLALSVIPEAVSQLRGHPKKHEQKIRA